MQSRVGVIIRMLLNYDNGIKDGVYQGIVQIISNEESTFDIEKSKPLFRRLWRVVAVVLLLSVSVSILFFNNITHALNHLRGAYKELSVKGGLSVLFITLF